MAYEIRLRRNKWDPNGGWNWRIWAVKKGGYEELVEWGWAPSQAEALNDANYHFDILEAYND